VTCPGTRVSSLLLAVPHSYVSLVPSVPRALFRALCGRAYLPSRLSLSPSLSLSTAVALPRSPAPLPFHLALRRSHKPDGEGSTSSSSDRFLAVALRPCNAAGSAVEPRLPPPHLPLPLPLPPPPPLLLLLHRCSCNSDGVDGVGGGGGGASGGGSNRRRTLSQRGNCEIVADRARWFTSYEYEDETLAYHARPCQFVTLSPLLSCIIHGYPPRSVSSFLFPGALPLRFPRTLFHRRLSIGSPRRLLPPSPLPRSLPRPFSTCVSASLSICPFFSPIFPRSISFLPAYPSRGLSFRGDEHE